MTAAQLPAVRAPAQDAGRGLWRQQVLPVGSLSHPKWGELEFSPAILRELVATFDAGAMDQVAYTLVDDANRHTSDPDRVRGEIRALELADDGLYALIDPLPRGRALLRENPRQPVSARITVPESGPFAGRPVLAHVAATPDPVARGMRPGEWVEASNTGELLIDLSNGEWEGLDKTTASEHAEAAARAWMGAPAPKAADLSMTAEAKLTRQINATIELYGSGPGATGVVVDDFS